MSTSEKISAFALCVSVVSVLVSIVVGFLNYRHTTRSFHVTTTPPLKYHLLLEPRYPPTPYRNRVRFLYTNGLTVQIKNLSTNLSVERIDFQLDIAVPKKYRNKAKPLITIANAHVDGLEPLEEKAVALKLALAKDDASDRCIEEIIDQFSPGVLRRIEDKVADNATDFHFVPDEFRQANIKLHISYLPGVANSRAQKVLRLFQITPYTAGMQGMEFAGLRLEPDPKD